MSNKDSAANVEELSKKLDQVLSRLSALEELVKERPEFDGLAAALRLTRVGVGMYGEPLKIASRLKDAQSYLQQQAISKDEISRCIIQALAVKGALNISAVTRQVSAMRGKASRRIIRERIQKLLSQGVIVKTDSKTPTYDLANKTTQ